MPSSPLLTIAIPTYNRARNLEILLEALVPQLDANPQVELLISDNASPDHTPQVVERFLAAGLRARYIRNESNVGPDPNFIQCYNLALGKYVWIFGDDDFLFPGALTRLTTLLSQDDYDLVYLRPFSFSQEPNERGFRNPDAEVRRFTSGPAFVHNVNLRGDFALITACIVNKQSIDRHPHPGFELGRDTYLVQLGWVFTALRNFRAGLIVDRGLYAVCEFNPQRNFDIVRVFGPNWAHMAGTFLESGSPIHRQVLFEQLYGWFVTNWYGTRRTSHLTHIVDPTGQMRPVYGSRPAYWIIVYPLLTWPMFPAGCWLFLWRTIRRIDAAIAARLHPAMRSSQ